MMLVFDSSMLLFTLQALFGLLLVCIFKLDASHDAQVELEKQTKMQIQDLKKEIDSARAQIDKLSSIVVQISGEAHPNLSENVEIHENPKMDHIILEIPKIDHSEQAEAQENLSPEISEAPLFYLDAPPVPDALGMGSIHLFTVPPIPPPLISKNIPLAPFSYVSGLLTPIVRVPPPIGASDRPIVSAVEQKHNNLSAQMAPPQPPPSPLPTESPAQVPKPLNVSQEKPKSTKANTTFQKKISADRSAQANLLQEIQKGVQLKHVVVDVRSMSKNDKQDFESELRKRIKDTRIASTEANPTLQKKISGDRSPKANLLQEIKKGVQLKHVVVDVCSESKTDKQDFESESRKRIKDTRIAVAAKYDASQNTDSEDDDW
jgi:hypothetical protein